MEPSVFGYVGRPANVATATSFAIDNNAFAELRNSMGVSAIAIQNATVSGPASIAGNCFDNSGGGVTILVFGTFDTLDVRANVVVNTPGNGAGGVGLSGFASALVVADNRVVDSPADGFTLAMSADTGGVTGNIVRGSGAGAASGFANLQVTNVALAAGFLIRNSDLASPASMNSAIISTPNLVAECNWFGSGALATVSALITGNVDFSPFLTLGTDTAGAPGFQPVAGTCTGQ